MLAPVSFLGAQWKRLVAIVGSFEMEIFMHQVKVDGNNDTI